MQVREVMTADVNWIAPETTLEDAARMMRDRDIGVLPVGSDDRLVGVVTDRDLVIRGMAEGKSPQSQDVRGAMSENVFYCYDDTNAKDAASSMAENQIRRMPVVDRDKRLVGIVSLGDLAVRESPAVGGETLAAVAR